MRLGPVWAWLHKGISTKIQISKKKMRINFLRKAYGNQNSGFIAGKILRGVARAELVCGSYIETRSLLRGAQRYWKIFKGSGICLFTNTSARNASTLLKPSSMADKKQNARNATAKNSCRSSRYLQFRQRDLRRPVSLKLPAHAAPAEILVAPAHARWIDLVNFRRDKLRHELPTI